MRINAAEVLLGGHDAASTALACDAERVTYGELRDRVARAAATWRRYGLAAGDRVAIRLPDGCAWVAAYLGAMWAGGVAVGVNPRIPAEDWEYVLREGAFRFVLADSRDGTPAAYRDRVVTLDDWLLDVAIAMPVAPALVDAETPAFWCHSSGSSGRPKAVVQPHRFALGVERVAAELIGVGPRDRLYASSKLFFAYPLGNSLFSGLKLGATVILDPQWPTPASVVATVAVQRPTVLFSVPSLYRSLLKEGYAGPIAQCGVRAYVSAGEALPSSLREEWRMQTGRSIANGFGASETLSLVLWNGGDGDALSPAPGVEIVGVNQPDNGLPTRVRIGGPMVALGYFNRPDAQAEHFSAGTFCPADLFESAGPGAWRFAGREDSLVKINGRWVNLVELEERLVAACPGIAEAAAVAVPDADGVAAVAFFYALKPGAPHDVDATLEAHARKLPPYQRPRWMHGVDALPRTPTGKLLRRKLRELHEAYA